MDSATLESLSDTSNLPDLNFEDYLLDDPPMKKFPTSIYNNNDNDVTEEAADKNVMDETLNTPEPKRLQQQQHYSDEASSEEPSKKGENVQKTTSDETSNADLSIVQKKTNLLGTPTPPTTPKPMPTSIGVASTSHIPSSSSSSGMPVLLNSKIALSKTSNTPQTIVKIATAQKLLSSPSIASINVPTSATIARATTLGGDTTMEGKTALKTTSGQIVYIQKGQMKTVGTTIGVKPPTAVRIKTSTVPITSAITSSSSSDQTSAKLTPLINSSASGSGPKLLTTTSATANIGGNKTVIQLIRSADGKLMPLKATHAAGAKGTLTLSPTITAQLAGKKLITSGGQIVLKSATSALSLSQNNNSTNSEKTAGESVATAAKPIKIQKIMAPSSSIVSNLNVLSQSKTSTNSETSKPITTATSTSTTAAAAALSTSSATSTTTTTSTIQLPTAGGKVVVKGTQLVVPNSQIIKLSPGNSANSNTAGNTSNSSTAGVTGALHAIQIPGKQGLQYFRVVSAPNKSSNSSSPAEAPNATITSSAANVLNSIPPKFAVVRPNTASKIILTKSPKSDGNTIFSPISSNKMKTIVTVPTLRSIASSNDSSSTSPANVITSASLIKSAAKPTDSIRLSATTTTTTTTTANYSLTSNGSQLRPKPKISEINSEIQRLTASGEVKKVVSGPDGKRYLIMPRSVLRTAQIATSTANLGDQQEKQQQQLQQDKQHPTTQTKVYSFLKADLNSAGKSEGAMKSFVICKPTQNTSDTTVQGIQVKRPSNQIQQSQSVLSLKKTEEINRISPQILPIGAAHSSINKFVPIKIKQEPQDSDDLNSLLFSEEAFVRGGIRRKHCNCSKSQCLKLYCDCFANGEFCQDCTCKDCFNNLQYEDERQRAIKSCLERNPSAFKPKITTSSDQGDTRLHNKGCNCKRSGCLKNYCECFEAKIPCSSNCKCVGCRNIEDRPDLDMDPIDPKLLESITNASMATNNIARAVSTSNQAIFASGMRRTYDKAFTKNERKSESDNAENDQQKVARKRQHLDEEMSGAAALLASPRLGENIDDDGNAAGEKRNSNFITQEVIDATIQCMISQADECLKNNLQANQIEKMVLEELGRCLVEIIDFSIRNTDTSFSQN